MVEQNMEKQINKIKKKNIKWIIDSKISFNRGNYSVLIAKLNNCNFWLTTRYYCSTSTFKSDLRKLAQRFSATEIIIKLAFNNNNGKTVPTENRVISFMLLNNRNEYLFSEFDDLIKKDKFYKSNDIFVL